MTATRTRTGRSASSGRDRFRARRTAVERRRGLKRLRLVVGLTAVTTLAVVVIGFLNSSWFDVDEVIVNGSVKSDPGLIVEAAGIEPGQALLELDLDRSAEAVQLVPWVGTALVTRSWSGTIEISVTERGPSVVLDAGDGFALVDDHGRQLEIVEARPEGYMPVVGIEGSGIAGEPAPQAAIPVIALLEALPAEVERQITAVVVDGGDLYLRLEVGGRANFGDGTDLGPKLQALETMLDRVDLTCIDTIDVRVPSAPVVTRTGAAAGRRDSSPDQGTDGSVTSEPSEEPDYAAADC